MNITMGSILPKVYLFQGREPRRLASISLGLMLCLEVGSAQPGRAQSPTRLITGNSDSPMATAAAQKQQQKQQQKQRQKQRPKPPSKGRFVTAGGAASRGCGDAMMGLQPTELLENGRRTTGGFTTAARPTLFAYIPYKAQMVKSLKFQIQDESDQVHYQTQLAIPQRPGLIEIRMPQSAPPLDVGVQYRWFLEAELNCQEPSIAVLPFQQIKGWIERYQPDETLSQGLAANPLNQAQVYGEYGIWFDAAAELMALWKAQPGNAQLSQSWSDLLALYGLQSWAQVPLVDCCQAVAESAGLP